MLKALGGLVKAVLVFALVLAALAGLRAYFGGRDGEPCTNSLWCARLVNGQCLQDPRGASYCTYRCEQTADCPRGWSCVSAQGYGTLEATTQQVCVRTSAAAATASDGGVRRGR